MFKKSIIILLIILFPCLLYAGPLQEKHRSVIARQNVAGGTCDSGSDEAVAEHSGSNFTYQLPSDYVCTLVTLDTQSDITGYRIRGCDNGGSGDNLVKLYTNSAGEPGSEVSTDLRATVDPSAWSACNTHQEAEVLLDGGTYDNLAAGDYWICWDENSGTARSAAIDTGCSSCAAAAWGTPGDWTTNANYSGYGHLLGCND